MPRQKPLKLTPVMAVLLADIEAFLANTGMVDSQLGEQANHDKHLVKQVREGRQLRHETEQKVRRFMAKNRGKLFNSPPRNREAGRNAADPAPNGATWPNCGHPKTPGNTQRIGVAGDRCRICRRRVERESHRRLHAEGA
jgi:hypothetical protein